MKLPLRTLNAILKMINYAENSAKPCQHVVAHVLNY